MPKDFHDDIFTVGIGGAAGDGVLEAGSNLGLLLHDLGYQVYLSSNYPSLIRGGHNFVRVSFSKQKIWTDYSGLDAVIALNEETIKLHKKELNENGVIFADSFDPEDLSTLGTNAVVVPMLASVKNPPVPAITRNSVALGALCYLLDLPLQKMTEILERVFVGKMPDVNIRLASIGYAHMQQINFRHGKKIESGEVKGQFLDGSVTFSKGLEAAGLDFYLAYPMTPSSPILHYLAKQQRQDGLKVIQPENEISVINMALGMSFVGKRVAVGSATGGFSLMQEAFSFAGGAELPLVVAVCQRQAPATGVPTHSSQSDLRFALSSGHGEFPRIVIAPGDPEESFSSGVNALNFAWKFQMPIIVLLDKILCEHMMTVSIDEKSFLVEHGKMAENPDASYSRYKMTEDGISPMAFPGSKNAVIKVTSYEHDEHGITTEETDEIKSMIDKRFSKIKSIEAEMQTQQTVKVYGDQTEENAIVFFGSTKGAVLEASKYFEKPVKLVQIVWLEPFDVEKVKKELSGAKHLICVEGNHEAQLAGLIRQKTGIEVMDKILKYDSLPFDVDDLAESINKILK
jgi:2-oxoglutarate ferredoxin oxidoreductase subunit alpha